MAAAVEIRLGIGGSVNILASERLASDIAQRGFGVGRFQVSESVQFESPSGHYQTVNLGRLDRRILDSTVLGYDSSRFKLVTVEGYDSNVHGLATPATFGDPTVKPFYLDPVGQRAFGLKPVTKLV